MKKLFIVALALLGMVGSVRAGCVGPYCWDDKGPAIAGYTFAVPASNTKANLNSQAPAAANLQVFCSDCTNFWGGKIGGVCISSGTGLGAWVQISSAAAVGNCN